MDMDAVNVCVQGCKLIKTQTVDLNYIHLVFRKPTIV